MTGIEMIRQENLKDPHVLVGMTEQGTVVAPLAKVLEAMDGFEDQGKEIALLPCVVLASDGVLVQDHLVHMQPGAVFWFDIPSTGRIRSMLATVTKDAEEAISAFLHCYKVAKGDILVAAKTENIYKEILDAFAKSEIETVDGLRGIYGQGGTN
jgi:hypothetical protein